MNRQGIRVTGGGLKSNKSSKIDKASMEEKDELFMRYCDDDERRFTHQAPENYKIIG
jgi:hypothetical protein